MFSLSWRVLGGITLYLTFTLGGPARADDMGELRDCLAKLHQAEAKFLTRVPSFMLRLDGNLLQIARGVQFIDQNTKTLEHNLAANPKDPNFAVLASNAVEGCRGYLNLFDSRLRFYLIFIGCILFTAVVLTLTLGFNMVPVNPTGGPKRGHRANGKKTDLSTSSAHSANSDRLPSDRRR